MALSIVVNGGGTFSASMEEGPVSFTASLGAVPGPQGPTGATGPTGVVAATAPILYDSGTQTVSIDSTPTFEGLTIGVDGNPFSTTINGAEITLTGGVQTLFLDDGGIIFPDSTVQTTAFIGEARKEILTARNNTGSTIAAGKVVYLSGATGNKPTVALALASSESTSARTIGITAEAIADNADGKVVISGAVENIDTSAFTAGDVVYLSSSTAGGLQTTLPAAPLHGVVIGIVTRSNPSVGSIEVFVQNYQELQELSDVSVADRANNDGLFWETSSSTWRSKTIAEVLGLTPIALGSLSGVSPVTYNSSTGEIGFDSTTFLLKSGNLSGLADVGTARTNLGLGSAATSSTADFAAAVHTHTASAITDFDTAVPTAVPAASTTVAGKVELATDAEAIAGTSNTLAVTPATVASMLGSGNYTRFIGASFNTGTSGTGGLNDAFAGGLARRTNGPTSANAGHVRASQATIVQQGLATNNNIDWAKRIILSARVVRTNINTTNESIYRLTLGEVDSTNTGDLTVRGIGVKVTGGGAMELLVHDGTTLTTVSTSHTPAVSQAFSLVLVSNGAGTVEAFVNGSSVGSTTGGPTDRLAGTGAQNAMITKVENTSSFASSPQQYIVYAPAVLISA